MEAQFTERQRRFIEAFEGNGTEAARLAGYTGSDNVLGKTAYDLLRNPKIAQAVKERQDKRVKSLIASREQRQGFWTKVMNDAGAEMRDRLRASELLGKSEADFTEKVEHSGSVTLADLVAGSKDGEKK